MNSKILFSGLLFFIFSASNFLFGQCPSILETQYQIDNFSILYPNCTEITSSLTIEERDPATITNLSGLSQITKIKTLYIRNNAALINLQGLNNLTEVTDINNNGRLYIINNQSLQSLQGLENLQEVSQILSILDNSALTSIEALANLSSTTMDIVIENNPSLTSLLGLNNITFSDGIFITNNNALVNLNGLNNLTGTESLKIIANQNLIDLQGLNSLMNVGEHGIEIYANPSLESFDGLENLVSSASFYISGNISVTSIEGFSSLSTSSNFGIVGSPLLTNLNGLENLTSVYFLDFEGNDMLSNISALSNVDMTNLYSLVIHGSPQLSVCNYPNICQYLNDPSNYAIIYDNASGCNTRVEILQACGLLDISENTDVKQITIYPNPTSNNFTILGIEKGIIQITDSRGRILKTFAIEKDELELNGLAEGIYFVNISNEKGSATKRLIKI